MSFEEISDQYVEVRGSRIHYKEMGEGDPILFVHGNLTHSYLWRDVMPRMAKHGRCIAVDLVGMGKSDRPRIAYNIQDQNDYFFEFIQKLGLKNVLLIGNEWGATLSMNYFAMTDHNVRGLILMEPVIGGATTTELMASGKPLLKQYGTLRQDPELDKKVLEENLLFDEILPQFSLKPLAKEVRNEYQKPFMEDSYQMPLLGLFEALPVGTKPRASITYLTLLRGPLYSINKPKLLIRSEDSYYLTSEGINYMKERMSGLNIKSVGKAGILIPEDKPEEVSDAIEQWYLDHFGN
ncbi:MAG: haloalkane dehalogenase [Roseivirga sp.]|nr:haloalkane dehalogenase [Roseivirga sp.]